MDDLVIRLIEVTQQEIFNFQKLLGVLNLEQQALMNQDIKALKSTLKDQRTISKVSVSLEKDRTEVINQLAIVLKEDRDGLTLKRLVERITGPHKVQLEEIRSVLLELQIKIQKANRQNTLLINQSMKYVDKTIHILSGSSNSGGVYEQTGKIENILSPVSGIVDEVV